VEDVLDGLSDRFALLDDALRGLPERHASLWAMVDWSRELLAAPERTLMQRLAVVAGSFTADLAVSVADQPPNAVRRGLAVPVEQSLLTLADQDDGPARYRMLETVREYGEARLDAVGDRPAAMTGLVRWAAERAATLGADFVGPAQVVAFEACARDQETLLAAARWAADHDDEPALVDILATLFWLWTVRGAHGEVITWSTRALHPDNHRVRATSALLRGRATGRPLPDADRAAIVGMFAAVNSGVIESVRLAVLGSRVCRTALRERRDEISPRVAALASTLPALGFAGDAMIAPAADLVAADDPFLQGIGLFLRAAIAENLGESGSSADDAREAYERFRTIGDHWGMGMAAQGIGQWISGQGAADSTHWLGLGARHLEHVGAIQDARSIRVLLDVQNAISGQTDALRRIEQLAASDQADATDVAQARLGLAQVAWHAGDLDAAVRHADGAAQLAQSEEVRPHQARVVFRVGAATIHLRATRNAGTDVRAVADARAAHLLRAAAVDALQGTDMPVLGSFALGCAELAAERGQDDMAVELFMLGSRLGANIAWMFQLGTGGWVEELAGDATERAEHICALRDQKPQAVTARIRELVGDLLG
jgi:hypothetical protein